MAAASDVEIALATWRAYPPGTKEERRATIHSAPHLRAPAAHEAAALNDADKLRELLLRPTGGTPVDVDTRDRKGLTALHHAIRFGALDCAAMLLAAGWDADAEDSKGLRPLDYAAQHKHRYATDGAIAPASASASAPASTIKATDDASAREAQAHDCAAHILLLLHGATPEAKSTVARDHPSVVLLLTVWDTLAAAIEPGCAWEGSDATCLRSWAAFASAARAAEPPRGARLLGPGCELVRFILETHLPVAIRQAIGSKVPDVRGTYTYDGLFEGRPSYDRPRRFGDPEGMGRRLRWRGGCWELVGPAGEVVVSSEQSDGPVLGSTWTSLVMEGAEEAFNTYSSSSFLPPVRLEEDVPFLGLLNPSSGSKLGKYFLEEAEKFPMWRGRLFNIVHVVTRPTAARAFRARLEAAKREAAARGTRPRLVVGGGDGTASFALYTVFKVLFADADGSEGDGTCQWPDAELEASFPALVQMPLGTGNDFAGMIGWGRAIDPLGSADATRSWLKAAISKKRPLQRFDVWGILPAGEPGAKICTLAGTDENHPDRARFKVAGPSVPFLSFLYMSLGYEAFVAAQVELNRSDSRLWNFIEYGNRAQQALVGTQRKNIDLSGVTVMVPVTRGSQDDGTGGMKKYFPPADRISTGSEYASVGCMNVNSYAGGLVGASDPAVFNDGLIDLFRQRSYLGNLLRRGNAYDTEKVTEAELCVPKELPGVHFQFDGEARFLFHPDAKDIRIKIKRVMQVPVVLGPDSQEVPMSACAGWLVVHDRFVAGTDAAFLPARSISECKEICVRHGFGGFCVLGGKAFFREEGTSALKERLAPKVGSSVYIRDKEAQEVTFNFKLPEEELPKFKRRLHRWVSGSLARSLNATEEECESLEWRSDNYAQGICARSARAYISFRRSSKRERGFGDGAILTFSQCAACQSSCGNWGCKGCRRSFCRKCFMKHRGDAPVVVWGYHDVGLLESAFCSSSSELCLNDALEELFKEGERTQGRPIKLKIFSNGQENERKRFEHAKLAHAWLEEFKEEDQRISNDPKTLVSFVQQTLRGDTLSIGSDSDLLRSPRSCTAPGAHLMLPKGRNTDIVRTGSLQSIEDFLEAGLNARKGSSKSLPAERQARPGSEEGQSETEDTPASAK